jgi:hypothetical protein
MSPPPEALQSDLYAGPWPLSGNTAKVKVIHEVHKIVSESVGTDILDVGCVGPRPFDLWAPLLDSPTLSFRLTGVDVLGLVRLETTLCSSGGWIECSSMLVPAMP